MDLGVVGNVLGLFVFLFLILLLGRFALDWIQVFARDWQPRGPMLVVAETVYSATDPPLKALRKVLPPLTIGAVRIDLAFLVLMLGVLILLRIL